MGIVANAKQFIAKKVISGVEKVGDGVAKCAVLSPKQLAEVEDKRIKYLSEKPDMNGGEIKLAIEKNMGAIGIEVYQAYLDQLSNVYSPVDVSLDSFDEINRIRFFDIKKWVVDADEQSIDKLVNVYQVLSEEECNIALIYNRTQEKCEITVGVVNTNENHVDPAIVDKYYSRLVGAIKGNFPGVDIKEMANKSGGDAFGVGVPKCLDEITNESDGSVKSIAVVSNVASEKSDNFISQSMEKLLDGVVPQDETEEYTIVLLAKPLKDQLENRNRLYELYTALAPYAKWQTGYTYTESDGVDSSANFGVNLGVNAGAHAMINSTSGTSTTKGSTEGHSNSIGAHLGGKIAGVNAQHTNSKSETNTMGSNESSGMSAGFNASANFGVSFSRASSVSANVGKNESLTQDYTNYGVQHTLEIIESQIARIEESAALGMWGFASYIISDNPVIVNNVAHMYLALTQGDKSYLTRPAINFWDGDIDTVQAKNILSSIRKLQHPVFGLNTGLEESWLMYPTLVTPTTPLSGKELAKALNFPRKSVSGVPVLNAVSFGREPQLLIEEGGEEQLELGCGYHMRKTIEGQRIGISMQELTKHTFITGSTGSGKSNTVYKLLEKAKEKDIPFLVIEPAKGEYKDAVGKWEGVTTYGTNPKLEKDGIAMLRINPFRFPSETHILEHLDRLVEIFNVCWPMYAAMPAILKDAVERAYVSAGWDLEKSENKYDEQIYPTFADVVKQIKVVLDESEYSADNKGDYTGSLVTRLRSLTNGINGLIFTNDDIEDENLFDKQVIVDLSRVGSSETKSLIMGLLVLKLQEYRAEKKTESNEELKHITVLEEAHNLLKRTSTEQVGEGANMIGKSVEMLANSIAEMRTYGEGFVIVDQSPGLLDMSVIRNTNTKIILRLPDFSDRQLVGKAAGLSDDQITELSRLERGVAVLSQSDWLEPVLCKIDRYNKGDYKNKDRYNAKTEEKKNKLDNDKVRQSLLECIMNKELYRKGDRIDIEKLRKDIIQSKLDTAVKCKFMEYISSKDDVKAFESLRKMVYEFLNAGQAFERASDSSDIVEWVHAVANHLEPKLVKENSTGEALYTKQQMDLVMALLVYEQSLRDATYKDVLIKFWEMYESEGGVY